MHEPRLPDDDHRSLIGRLDLCHFQDEAPGMVFWHPRGYTLYRVLEQAARAHVLAGGYREVRTPQLAASSARMRAMERRLSRPGRRRRSSDR